MINDVQLIDKGDQYYVEQEQIMRKFWALILWRERIGDNNSNETQQSVLLQNFAFALIAALIQRTE